VRYSNAPLRAGSTEIRSPRGLCTLILRKRTAGSVSPSEEPRTGRQAGQNCCGPSPNFPVAAPRGSACHGGVGHARRVLRGIFGRISPARRIMSGRLADNTLVIAGTSAGATALGPTIILGGDACGRPRTGPGLGLVPGVIIDMHFAQRGRLPPAGRRGPRASGTPRHRDRRGHRHPHRSSRFDVLGRGAAVTVDVRPGSAIRQHTLRAGDAFDLEHRPPEPLMDE
jgi:hypothetical protein